MYQIDFTEKDRSMISPQGSNLQGKPVEIKLDSNFTIVQVGLGK